MHSNQPTWYCLRTHPKHEHVAAAHLALLPGVSAFNPQLRMVWSTRRGRVRRWESLFPNYLFAQFCLESMLEKVKHTPAVKTVLRFGDLVPSIPDSVIEDLRRTTEQAACLTFVEGPVPGEEVEIGRGPFEGFKGTVVSVLPSKERVKVLLDVLGGSVPAELSLDCILYRKRDPAAGLVPVSGGLPADLFAPAWGSRSFAVSA